MAVNTDVTSIDHLMNRSSPERHPIFSFKWICSSLPFGLDPTYVESLDLPFSNIAQGQGWLGGGTYTYFPDFSNISTFSLTLYEDSSMSTLQWITFWKNQVSIIYPNQAQDAAKQGGVYMLPKNYKRDMIFKLLATDNSEVLIVTLTSVWPTDTGNLSLDYSSSERIKLTQTFSCDGQLLEFKKPISAVVSGSSQNLVSSLLGNIFSSGASSGVKGLGNL